jgi:hypothetical protein
MNRNRLFSAIAAVVLALSLIVAGCGKKGDPLPPRVKLPKAISDLSAVFVPAGVEIRWSLPGKGEAIGHFKILRSETAGVGRACPGCPQDHQLLTALTVADGRFHDKGEDSFRYVDAAIREGRFYSYRVAACAPAGYCGDASNEAVPIRGTR